MHMKTLTALFLAAASFGMHGESTQAATITQIVAASGGSFDSNNGDYDILLNAVLAANLDETLNDPDLDVTVFAPNDRAFIRLARDLGFAGGDEAGAWNFLVGALTTLGNGDPIPVLTQVLLYHVSPQRVRPIELLLFTLSGKQISTLQGQTIRPLFLRLIDKDPELWDPIVTWPLNIVADNGRIHTISRVLLPVDLP
jgi:uncharacterized surface protein with fasciclin (FAS1) repeats